jgi:hypothetical protein
VVAWSFLSTSVLTINKEEYRFSEDAETTAYDSTDSSSRSPRGVRVRTTSRQRALSLTTNSASPKSILQEAHDLPHLTRRGRY